MGLSTRIIALTRTVDRAIELSKIDLGRKPVDYGCGSIGPSLPKPRVWYPSLWIEPQTQALDLPDSGKAVIEYKITRKTVTEIDGQQRHEATIEIHSIEAMKDGKQAKNGKKAAAKLPGSAKPMNVAPTTFAALAPGMIAFDRARNSDGEFAPQTDGGPDPSTMRAAYGPVQAQPGKIRSALGVAADAAGATGGLLTVGSMVAKKLRAAR